MCKMGVSLYKKIKIHKLTPKLHILHIVCVWEWMKDLTRTILKLFVPLPAPVGGREVGRTKNKGEITMNVKEWLDFTQELSGMEKDKVIELLSLLLLQNPEYCDIENE